MLTPGPRTGLEGAGGLEVERVLARGPGRVVARVRRPGETAPRVAKATTPGAGWRARAALRREARLLDRVRGPGVVDLVGVVDRRHTVLVLALVPPGHVVDVDDATRRLQATLDRFSALGLAHGRLGREHVLVDEGGRPVVCGLGHLRPGPPPAPGAARSVITELAAGRRA